MSYNINNFYAAAVTRDFARQFQFALYQIGTSSFLDSDELIYVETASLPGKQINNIPVPYMGLAFNVPGTVSYPGSAGYQMTFRCDAAYAIRSKFEQALQNLFNHKTSTGNYGIPGQNSILSFVLFDKQRAAIREYILYGVWVQSLGDAAYNVGDNGTIVQVQATLSYQYWETKPGKSTELRSITPPEPFPGPESFAPLSFPGSVVA